MKTKDQLVQLLTDIAAALGATFDQGYLDAGRGYIKMSDGVTFFANADYYGNNGKVHFSAHFPQHVENSAGKMCYTAQRNFSHETVHFDGIKVSVDKTPEQIAKDVTRRFLPTYVPLYAECLVWCVVQADYFKKQDEMQRLGEALFKYNGTGKVNSYVEYASPVRLDVRIDNLNAEQAKQLAALLDTF